MAEGSGGISAEGSVEAGRLKAGTAVEVRSRFEGSWSRGFEIEEALDEGYRIRRLSDGSVLPVVLHPDEIRRERRRQTWWV